MRILLADAAVNDCRGDHRRILGVGAANRDRLPTEVYVAIPVACVDPRRKHHGVAWLSSIYRSLDCRILRWDLASCADPQDYGHGLWRIARLRGRDAQDAPMRARLEPGDIERDRRQVDLASGLARQRRHLQPIAVLTDLPIKRSRPPVLDGQSPWRRSRPVGRHHEFPDMR